MRCHAIAGVWCTEAEGVWCTGAEGVGQGFITLRGCVYFAVAMVSVFVMLPAALTVYALAKFRKY